MDHFIFKIQNLVKKCEMLDNFCDLQLRKGTIQNDLKKLRKQVENVSKILCETKELYKIKFPYLKLEYQLVIQSMKERHLLIMNLLIQIKSKNIGNKVFQENKIIPTPLTPLQRSAIRPRMYISDYANSPYVKVRNMARQIQFINFEIKIHSDAFELIPKYMKGRETLFELQKFLDEILTPCFNGKYQLMYKKKEAIKTNELTLWKLYNAQSAFFPGKHFISQEDIVKKINKIKIDRDSLSKLTMLRHLGIIQIEQKEQVYYIWVEK